MIPDITYFILDYNPHGDREAREYLHNCMDSLALNRNPSITSEVYVINQGNLDFLYNTDLSHDCRVRGFHYIGLNNNLGIAGGINFASRLSRSPYLCLVTSDTTFTTGLDTVLLKELESHSDIYQITPSVDRGDVAYQVEGYTKQTDPIRCIAQELTIQFWKHDVFDLIGEWDERWIACYENMDYALRLFLSGLSSAISHKISCHHEHGTTNKNGSIATAYGGRFDHGPLRAMWDAKWPGLKWDMMYDPSLLTEENRKAIHAHFASVKGYDYWKVSNG